MKERPILFSAPMVRALLEGRKTQTRRVLKIKGMANAEIASVHKDGSGLGWIAWTPKPVTVEETALAYPNNEGFPCPYGAVGDRLWVRETWAELGHWDGFEPDMVTASDGGSRAIIYAEKTPDFQWTDEDGFIAYTKSGHQRSQWRPSIFMPRWASRLMLEITDIRVERLQSISEEDAMAEGMMHFPHEPTSMNFHPCCWQWNVEIGKKGTEFCLGTARHAFGNLWEFINGADSWELNPWVWAVSFEVVPL